MSKSHVSTSAESGWMIWQESLMELQEQEMAMEQLGLSLVGESGRSLSVEDPRE